MAVWLVGWLGEGGCGDLLLEFVAVVIGLSGLVGGVGGGSSSFDPAGYEDGEGCDPEEEFS